MCGITGIYAFNMVGGFYMVNLAKAIDKLSKRGPDGRGSFIDDSIGLGHRRLSIIDVSSNGSQPMRDESDRYVIVFNGEIFNYKSLKAGLIEKGVQFNSDSDTEVLLKLFIHKGHECLNDLVGFFAFAIYDKEEKSLFIARDRMGIKPLLYFHDEDKFIFASEMKSLLAYNIPKELDYTSLYQYLQLNYIPGPDSIFKNIKKVNPGTYLLIKDKKVVTQTYYSIPYPEGLNPNPGTYEEQKTKLISLLEESVKLRLIADVPLGAFLSGGIDSSAIVALASRHSKHLNTFSIGYKNESFFDETKYANLVAKKFNTNHTVFSLSNDDLFEHLYGVLDYIDEPFADSSALAVYILSKHTAQKVKVALSGDGADELFGGYNKHIGEYKVRNPDMFTEFISLFSPVLNIFPKSRNSALGNKIRQIHRFADGKKLSKEDRYWRWAAFAGENEAGDLLSPKIRDEIAKEYLKRKAKTLRFFSKKGDLNEVLRTDMELVLTNDMLFKVDSMSMANGLEVRVPFLDHHVVNYAFSLPQSSKIDGTMRKKILQDSFKDILPEELYQRPKKGFEVPLLKWLRTELKSFIEDDLLSDSFIENQGIFNRAEIKRLKMKLFSSNPEDTHARIWGLLVFQYWWKKYYL